MEPYKEFLNIVAKTFGADAEISLMKPSLPLIYSKNFYVYKIGGIQNAIVLCPTSDQIPLNLWLGIYRFFRQENERVFAFLSKAYASLIKPFEEYQIDSIDYLGALKQFDSFSPDLLEALLDKETESTPIYTKGTQLVAKFYLFNPIKSYTAREIGKRLNISAATVARSNVVLHQLKVLVKEGVGAGIMYTLISKPFLIQKLKPYFIKPYGESFLMMVDEGFVMSQSGLLLSGESALSEYSDLSAPKNRTVLAVAKNRAAEIQKHYSALRIDRPTTLIEIQFFIYDPVLFSKGKTIDLLDLYIVTEKKNTAKDPRVNQALKTIENLIIHG